MFNFKVAKKKRPIKNNLAEIYKIVNNQSTSAGFTLIELLVAMAITSIVISATGFGVVAITERNTKEKAETERRVELNRAQDFISDEVRTASKVNDSTSPPAWAWTADLGGGSPSAKLFLQIPLKVNSINAVTEEVTIEKHGFSAGNAVMFTGTDTTTGISKNVVYYVTEAPDANTFKVSTSLSNAKAGTAFGLNALGTGSLTANRLVTYYIRDNTSTWLGPKTINRSAGPCSDDYVESNCPVLVDSIAATNGFTATAISSRKAELDLRGAFSDSSPNTFRVKNNAFARLFEVIGGGKNPLDDVTKTLKDKKEAFEKAVEEAKNKEEAAKDPISKYNKAKEEADRLAEAAEIAAKTATNNPTAANYAAAETAAKSHAKAEELAASLAPAAQKAATEAAAAYEAAKTAATEYAKAERAAAEVDTTKAGEHNEAAQYADAQVAKYAAPPAEYTTTYNPTKHEEDAEAAQNDADNYREIATEKYTAAAKQAATEYANAKTDAANKATTAENTATQAASARTSTAYNTAAQANTNYAAAERLAAEKATAAQNALNEAERYIYNRQADTKYAAAPHITAAEAAELRAVDLGYAAVRATTNSVFTTNNGVITFATQATGTFKIIGGDAGALTPYTTTTIYKTALNGNTDSGTSVPRPANNQSPIITQAIAPAGTKLTVRGNLPKYDIYGGFTADSAETNRNTQVWALRNGDTLPPFTPYPGQVPPRNYLQAEGYLDANGRVKLADNQVIYLFEVTTTIKTRNDYDMQDIIVLATIEPTRVPIAPTITATVSGTPVTLSWSAVTHAAAYELYRCVAAKTGNCIPAFVSEVSSGVTQNVNTITSNNNNKICFAVKAKNSLGTSDLSNKLCSNRQGGKENP